MVVFSSTALQNRACCSEMAQPKRCQLALDRFERHGFSRAASVLVDPAASSKAD
jgi:hypothetical protein